MHLVVEARTRLIAAAAVVAGPACLIMALANADPLPYGPDTCAQGYVWREAGPSDHVCVTPETRHNNAEVNGLQGLFLVRRPDGTCTPGLVWREAYPGDHACADPSVREQVRIDNAAAASRLATAPQFPCGRDPIDGAPKICPPRIPV